MLDNWEENLALITANRTENDQLVIMHLGDCLLKEKHDVHLALYLASVGWASHIFVFITAILLPSLIMHLENNYRVFHFLLA